MQRKKETILTTQRELKNKNYSNSRKLMKNISMLLVCLIGALTAYAAEPYDFKADSLFIAYSMRTPRR